MEKLKEYAKQSVLVLMLGLALFMGFTVGYHYNKIVTNIINQKNIKTTDNTSVAINEKNQLLLINKQTGEYILYSDSIGSSIFNIYAKSIVSLK